MSRIIEELIPIFICCLLPLGIVFIVFWSKVRMSNNKTKLMTEALRAGGNYDPDKMLKLLANTHKSYRWRMIMNLRTAVIFIGIGIALACSAFFVDADEIAQSIIPGSICAAIGLGFLASYFVIRKQLAELNAEKEKEDSKNDDNFTI